MRNTGVEASLGYDHQWKNWNWNSQFTFSWNKNKIIELCKEWYNPITEETITMNRLQISKLGRAKFILKEGGSMGDLYSTTDLRRDDKGNIEIDEGGNVVVEDNLPDMKLGSVFPDYNLAWQQQRIVEKPEPRIPRDGTHRAASSIHSRKPTWIYSACPKQRLPRAMPEVLW